VSTSDFEFSSLTRSSRRCPHQYHSAPLSRPLFSYSYALFCHAQNTNSRILNHLRTLCTKHPGWGLPHISRFPALHPPSTAVRPPLVRLETHTSTGASLSLYMQERPGGPGTQVLTMRRFLIFAASLAILTAMASAQGRGAGPGTMSGMARPAVAAPRVAAPAGPIAGMHTVVSNRPISSMRIVRTRSGSLVARPVRRPNTTLRNIRPDGTVFSQDVPGLGFDFPHLAAVHPGRDHDRFRNRGFDGAFFPLFGGGGYYMPLFPDDVEEARPAEAQQVDQGQPESQRLYERPRPAEPQQNYAPAPQPAPVQESDQFVFVRRDGTLFFAVAYAWENGTLRYITREGISHTVAGSALDLNATQQFNEQRGLNFRLPA